MPEIGILAQVFDKSLTVLGLVRQGKKEKNDRIDQALFALYAALNETVAYLGGRNAGKRRDREREHRLAELWHNASVPLRHIDKDLAKLCFLKGSLWLEPEVWSDERVEENQLTIQNMLDSVRGLLLTR